MTDQELHAVFDLLDRQIVDARDQPVGKVDDLRLEERGRGRFEVVALLVGPQAFGHRIGGRIGDWIVAAARRAASRPEPVHIPIELVDEISASVKLTVAAEDIPRARDAENWLRDHFIGRIPGSENATE